MTVTEDPLKIISRGGQIPIMDTPDTSEHSGKNKKVNIQQRCIFWLF